MFVVCWSTCWGCKFDQCPGKPHTWRDAEDLEYAGLPVPDTPDGWTALAETDPCGCRCNGGKGCDA